ncbi:MAG: BolA/IbaG family iron-sulfur metabolism protein [Gammaproteobacteria bacterium]
MNEDIENAVVEGIGDAEVSVVVDGNRALITVVSDAFETLTRVQKQQKVYACIDELIRDGRLHAVTIRALTREEAQSGS